MNSLVVQQHNQNVQIRSQNIMLKQILNTSGVNVPLHIPDGTDIAYPTNISITSTSDMPHSPTYEHLRRHLLPKKDGNNELGPYKKYFMSLIIILSSDHQSGIPNLTKLFIFWFE